MLSKNNHSEFMRHQMPKKQHYTIKKLTVGVASVLIGLTFMGMNASADQISPATGSTTPATTPAASQGNGGVQNAEQPSETTDLTGDQNAPTAGANNHQTTPTQELTASQPSTEANQSINWNAWTISGNELTGLNTSAIPSTATTLYIPNTADAIHDGKIAAGQQLKTTTDDLSNIFTQLNGVDHIKSVVFSQNLYTSGDDSALHVTYGSPYLWMNKATQLESIDVRGLDTSSINNMQGTFMNMPNLKSIILGGHFTTARVTSMNQMFNGDTQLSSIDVTKLQMGSVADIGAMFWKCSSLPAETDFSSWDTHSLASAVNFLYMTNVQKVNITGWNTVNLTNSRNALPIYPGTTNDRGQRFHAGLIVIAKQTANANYSNLTSETFGQHLQGTPLVIISDVPNASEAFSQIWYTNVPRISGQGNNIAYANYGSVQFPVVYDSADTVLTKLNQVLGEATSDNSYQAVYPKYVLITKNGNDNITQLSTSDPNYLAELVGAAYYENQLTAGDHATYNWVDYMVDSLHGVKVATHFVNNAGTDVAPSRPQVVWLAKVQISGFGADVHETMGKTYYVQVTPTAWSATNADGTPAAGATPTNFALADPNSLATVTDPTANVDLTDVTTTTPNVQGYTTDTHNGSTALQASFSGTNSQDRELTFVYTPNTYAVLGQAQSVQLSLLAANDNYSGLTASVNGGTPATLTGDELTVPATNASGVVGTYTITKAGKIIYQPKSGVLLASNDGQPLPLIMNITLGGQPYYIAYRPLVVQPEVDSQTQSPVPATAYNSTSLAIPYQGKETIPTYQTDDNDHVIYNTTTGTPTQTGHNTVDVHYSDNNNHALKSGTTGDVYFTKSDGTTELTPTVNGNIATIPASGTFTASNGTTINGNVGNWLFNIATGTLQFKTTHQASEDPKVTTVDPIMIHFADANNVRVYSAPLTVTLTEGLVDPTNNNHYQVVGTPKTFTINEHFVAAGTTTDLNGTTPATVQAYMAKVQLLSTGSGATTPATDPLYAAVVPLTWSATNPDGTPATGAHPTSWRFLDTSHPVISTDDTATLGDAKSLLQPAPAVSGYTTPTTLPSVNLKWNMTSPVPVYVEYTANPSVTEYYTQTVKYVKADGTQVRTATMTGPVYTSVSASTMRDFINAHIPAGYQVDPLFTYPGYEFITTSTPADVLVLVKANDGHHTILPTDHDATADQFKTDTRTIEINYPAGVSVPVTLSSSTSTHQEVKFQRTKTVNNEGDVLSYGPWEVVPGTSNKWAEFTAPSLTNYKTYIDGVESATGVIAEKVVDPNDTADDAVRVVVTYQKNEQPSQPTNPNQPTNPTTPNKPSQPTNPTTPSNPGQSSKPSQPTTPNAGGQPAQGSHGNGGYGPNAHWSTNGPKGTGYYDQNGHFLGAQTKKSQQLPQTGNHSEAGLIGLGAASAIAMLGLAGDRRRN